MSPQIEQNSELTRVLGFWDAVAVLVGIVIGSGIFIVPAMVARQVPSLGPMILLWLLGGILSLLGSLSYAELASALPHPGGPYIFVRRAYGPLVAFIFGWTYLLIYYPASFAAIASIFALYCSHFVLLLGLWVRFVAVAAVVVVALINYLGVRQGSRTQNVLTLAKVVALVFIVLCGFLLRRGDVSHFRPLFSASEHGLSITVLGLALVGVLWTYDGWADTTAVAGEVKNPQKNMPRVLLFGMLTLTAIYCVINVAYVYLLPISQMAHLPLVASDAAQKIFGGIGATFVSALVMISTFGSLNGTMMAAPRVFFAMARDGMFIKKVGAVHPRFGTPHWAIATTTLLTVGFILSGTFEQIIGYFIFIAWIFYVLIVAGVILLRKKEPQLERPYKTWGYPLVPWMFILVGTGMVVNIFIETLVPSLIGVGIILMGVPIYAIWKRRARKWV